MVFCTIINEKLITLVCNRTELVQCFFLKFVLVGVFSVCVCACACLLPGRSTSCLVVTKILCVVDTNTPNGFLVRVENRDVTKFDTNKNRCIYEY